jgi:hypothetical protein
MRAFSLLLALTFAVAGALAAETRRPDPEFGLRLGFTS